MDARKIAKQMTTLFNGLLGGIIKGNTKKELQRAFDNPQEQEVLLKCFAFKPGSEEENWQAELMFAQAVDRELYVEALSLKTASFGYALRLLPSQANQQAAGRDVKKIFARDEQKKFKELCELPPMQRQAEILKIAKGEASAMEQMKVPRNAFYPQLYEYLLEHPITQNEFDLVKANIGDDVQRAINVNLEKYMGFTKLAALQTGDASFLIAMDRVIERRKAELKQPRPNLSTVVRQEFQQQMQKAQDAIRIVTTEKLETAKGKLGLPSDKNTAPAFAVLRKPSATQQKE